MAGLSMTTGWYLWGLQRFLRELSDMSKVVREYNSAALTALQRFDKQSNDDMIRCRYTMNFQSFREVPRSVNKFFGKQPLTARTAPVRDQ